MTTMKSTCFSSFYFLQAGVSALIGWNVILTSMDYIEALFPKYNVSFTLGFPAFAL